MFARYRIAYLALLALAAVEFAVTFGFGTATLDTYFKPGGFVNRMLPAWAILPLLWAGYVSVEITRRRIDRPIQAARRMLYRHRHWLGRGILFMALVLFTARSFTSFKSAIPQYVPFYADPLFVELDRAIFGTDPWRLTHALIGPFGTMVIDKVYALWFVVMMLYVGWFCFTRNQQLQIRGLLTHLLAWALLGNLGALAMSSVGPCFYEHFYQDPAFAPMMAQLRAGDQQHELLALHSMNYLLDSVGKDRFAAGISAMPSLHVAVAFLCMLVAWEYGRHWWAKLFGIAFFGFILVGSVHLGWHYAVDGIFSIAATWLIWWGTGRFLRWLEAREAGLQAIAPGDALPVAAPA